MALATAAGLVAGSALATENGHHYHHHHHGMAMRHWMHGQHGMMQEGGDAAVNRLNEQSLMAARKGENYSPGMAGGGMMQGGGMQGSSMQHGMPAKGMHGTGMPASQ